MKSTGKLDQKGLILEAPMINETDRILIIYLSEKLRLDIYFMWTVY